MIQRVNILTIALALTACSSGPPPTGVLVLGDGHNTIDSVEITTIAGPDVLSEPTDVALRPDVPSELWITNRGADAIVVLDDPGLPTQRATRYAGFGNVHFLPRPSALAFGTPDRLATIHEIDVPTQSTTPADFMGPTLWTTDRTMFDGGHASHFDMLHNSPNGVGIAWEQGNAYWIVDGAHGSLTRYDFQSDHGPGGEDHSDGIIARYVEGQIGYVPGVPAHAEYDAATQLLYVADPGHARVVALDVTSGTHGETLWPNYDGAEQYAMDGATLTTIVDGPSWGLVQPSGLALRDGLIFVSDHATSTIAAFDVDTGELVDWISLLEMVPANSLGGIAFDAEGRLYVADIAGSRVLRLAPR